MVRGPSRVEIAEARAAGVDTRFGMPIHVAMGADTYAIPNLAARRSPDAWYVITAQPGLVILETAGDRTIYIGDMAVASSDVAVVDAALATGRMLAGDRHASLADERRLAAGRCALAVGDAMVRGRLLDLVDGWSALAATGRILDRSGAHGSLIEPEARLALDCHVLIVTCPSTGRRYALRVPVSCTTAAEARLWSFGDDWSAPPEVET